MAKSVYMHYVNVLPEKLKADDHYFLRVGGNSAIHYIGGNDGSAIAVGSGNLGDMVMAIYDTNSDGVVDDSARLDGIPAANYVLKTDVPEVEVDSGFAIAMAIALG